MSKKAILGTLLASATLLGASVGHAATSDIKSESKKVTVTSDKAKLYKDSKLKESTTPKKGTVYQVNGYRDIDGKHVYRVYQTDKDNKQQYKGYIVNKDTKELKSETASGQYVAKKGATLWNNFYWNNKKSVTSEEKVYFAKYSYTLGDGAKYYSVYYKDKDGKDVWAGYTNASNVKALKATEETKYVKLKKDYNTWNNLYFKEHKDEFKASKGVNFKVKRYYTLNGNKYYSTYRTDENGKEVWTGYVNGYSSVVEDLKAESVDKKDQKVQVVKDYKTYSNHFFNKKGQLKDGKDVIMKVTYTYGNGKKYASLYDGDTWLGYANIDAVKSTLPLEEATKKANEAITAAKKALEDDKDKSESAKKELNDAIAEVEKAIKANDVEKVNDLNKAVDNLKATTDKYKNAATTGDLDKLKQMVEQVEKIPTKKEFIDATASKEDSDMLKIRYNAAKEILAGNRVVSHQTASDLYDHLQYLGRHLKLKTDKIDEAIEKGKKALENKANYLPGGVSNLESAVKKAEQVKGNNILKNFENFEAQPGKIDAAIKALKENAKTTMPELQEAIKQVDKIKDIQSDLASSKFDAIKKAYKNAEDIAKKDADTVAKEDVLNVKDSLVKTAEGMGINHTRLNKAEKDLQDDAKKYYLTADQSKEAKEKLEPIVKKADDAKTLKDYNDYNDAVKALEKAKQDMASLPSQDDINKIVKEYDALKEKAKDWKENKHKDVFSPETEAPFVDALKAVAEVGKAAEDKAAITKEQLAEAEKAPEAANNLRYNANLIDKKVNQPAEKLVEAAKTLGDSYAKTESNQTNLKNNVDEARTTLGLSKKADNVKAINDNHWNVNGWKAIDDAEKAVVKSGKNLQSALKKPLQSSVTTAEEKLKANNLADETRKPLQAAVNKAEDDLNNNKYDQFASDKKAVDEALKNVKENGVEVAKQLQATITKVDKIKTDVQADDLAKSEFTNIKSAYEKAEQLVKSPAAATKAEVEKANENLINAAKSIKLNTAKLQKEGAQFKKMVGENGDGGTYYIDNTQTSQLTAQKSGSLNTIYNAGVEATTLDKYEAYNKADMTMKDAIHQVEEKAPKMEDVRKARSYQKQLKDAQFYGEKNKPQNEKVFEANTVKSLKASMADVKKISDNAPKKDPITKAEVTGALGLEGAVKALAINYTGLEEENTKAIEYANSHKSDAKTEADQLLEKTTAAQKLLDNHSDFLVVEGSNWNTEDLTKVKDAAEAVYKAAKEVSEQVKVAKENCITDDEKILNDTPALASLIAKSDKSSEGAKELAKVVDAAYQVDKNSIGDEEKNIAKIDINKAWTDFGGSGHGSYYDAMKDLQDYARNTTSVTSEALQKDKVTLTKDMDNLVVLTYQLQAALDASEKAEIESKILKIDSLDSIQEEAQTIISKKQTGIENWQKINQLTAQLKEAAQKLTAMIKK